MTTDPDISALTEAAAGWLFDFAMRRDGISFDIWDKLQEAERNAWRDKAVEFCTSVRLTELLAIVEEVRKLAEQMTTEGPRGGQTYGVIAHSFGRKLLTALASLEAP